MAPPKDKDKPDQPDPKEKHKHDVELGVAAVADAGARRQAAEAALNATRERVRRELAAAQAEYDLAVADEAAATTSLKDLHKPDKG